MTHDEAVALLRAYRAPDYFAQTMASAGIMALDNLEKMVSHFYAKHPKAVAGSLKINGRTLEEARAYIVDFYRCPPSNESDAR